MPNNDELMDETPASTPAVEVTPVDDVDVEPAETAETAGVVTLDEGPTPAAARMLELATMTADQLVSDATTQAASLVSTARSEAESILAASRTEAHRAADDLARTKRAQAAELDRERATAMVGLADEKAALEGRIAALRQLQNDHQSRLRDHLTEQLSALDAIMPESPVAVAG